MVQLTDKGHWAIEVPDDAIEITVYQFKHYDRSIPYWHINWNYPKGHRYTSSGFCFFYKMFGGKKKYPTILTFLFTTKDVTEEQARQIIDPIPPHYNCYIDYTAVEDERTFVRTVTAIDSLSTLLRSKGLDVNKNYAILKRNDNG